MGLGAEAGIRTLTCPISARKTRTKIFAEIEIQKVNISWSAGA